MVEGYAGKTATVVKVIPGRVSGPVYQLDIDMGTWCWWNRCLEYEDAVLNNTGGTFSIYKAWFDLKTTPKKLKKYAKLYRSYCTTPTGKLLKVLGFAPHGRAPESYPKGVALLQDPDTLQVYMYSARNLYNEET